jgi:hypothetical protein
MGTLCVTLGNVEGRSIYYNSSHLRHTFFLLQTKIINLLAQHKFSLTQIWSTFNIFFNPVLYSCGSSGSAVHIATGYGLDDRGLRVWVWVAQECSFLHVVQAGSDTYQAFVKGKRQLLHLGQSCQSVKLTTRFQLLPRLRERRSIQLLSHNYSWRTA